MLDALSYLDGVCIPRSTELEVVDDLLSDNAEEEPIVKVPEIRGMPAEALLAFAEYAQSANIIRRHPRTVFDKAPEEIWLFYELTPSGRYLLKILEALTDVTSLPLSQ